MVDEFSAVLKRCLDPLFVVFVLLIISYVIFFRSVKQKSDTLILLLAIVLLYAASIPPVSNYLCYVLEKDYLVLQNNKPIPLDVIAVFGGGTKHIHPLKQTLNTDISTVRVVHAVKMYRQSQARYFVCSGRGERGDAVSEAQVMAQLAESLGVPRSSLQTESRSTNTAENARELHRLIGNRKAKIGLVTSAFHMKRARREAEKYFDQVIPLPAHYLYASPGVNPVLRFMPQAQELYKTSLAVREIVAQGWYAVK